MILGIVGSEAAKLTHCEGEVKSAIYGLFHKYKPSLVVSGQCHLGGVDILAVEAASNFGIPYLEFPPANKQWSTGYKPRNIAIAYKSDRVVCITVKELPPDYTGMRFKSCYHCDRARDKSIDLSLEEMQMLSQPHVKSGGCWTMHYARNLGKSGELIVI